MRNHVINFEVKYNFGTLSPLFSERMPKYRYLTIMTRERYRSNLPWRMHFSFVRGEPCVQFLHTTDLFFYKGYIRAVFAHFRVEKIFFRNKNIQDCKRQVKGTYIPSNKFLRRKLWQISLVQTHRRTHRQTNEQKHEN